MCNFCLLGLVYLIFYIVGLLVFILVLFLVLLYLSFIDYNLISVFKWIGLENYIELFIKDCIFKWLLFVMLIYVFIMVLFKFVFVLFIVYILNYCLWFINFFCMVFYVLLILGGLIVIVVLWCYIFVIDGLVNMGLIVIGMELVNWFGDF